VKATHVPDIRQALGTPGAIEFNAFKRQMFYTCPCGCGLIASVELMKCYATRKPAGIYEMVFGPDGKPAQGTPLVIGLKNDDGSVHWHGELDKDTWYEYAIQKQQSEGV
jgi:hypothetical protein